MSIVESLGQLTKERAFPSRLDPLLSLMLQGEEHYLNVISKMGFSAEGEYEKVPLGNKSEIQDINIIRVLLNVQIASIKII